MRSLLPSHGALVISTEPCGQRGHSLPHRKTYVDSMSIMSSGSRIVPPLALLHLVARMNGGMFLRSTSVAVITSFAGHGSRLCVIITCSACPLTLSSRTLHTALPSKLLTSVIPPRPSIAPVTPPDYYPCAREPKRATMPPPVSLVSLSLSKHLTVVPRAAPISLRVSLLRASCSPSSRPFMISYASS